MNVDYVLDTSALCAFHLGETGWDIIKDYLKNCTKAIHAVNAAEFCYSYTKRALWLHPPKEALRFIHDDGADIIDILDPDFLVLTAEIRIASPALSVGDGFAVALASILDVPVLTTDRAFKQATDFARIELIR